jgi:hypothetical protein
MSRAPVSVLLPTVRWTAACADVAGQLADGDELLVVCDSEDDPVTGRESLPSGVEVVVAGDPVGCSGKANAIDVGMDRASNERIVWTDDDFHHPENWLDTLTADYEDHGPASEVPFFVGTDPLSTLLEPTYALSGTFLTWLGDVAWGGSLVFERSDLDVAAFRDELRRSVSDDGILGEHLDVTTLGRARRVDVGGTVRETLERHVRFVKLVRFHAPGLTVANTVAGTLALALCLLFPLAMAATLTVGYGAIYAAFGQRRWTVLLAYPATLTALPLLLYGLARRTFVWGGRRYRWHGKFDVEIVE